MIRTSQRRSGPRARLALFAAGFTALAGTTLRAQPSQPRDEYLARSISRLALIDLRRTGQPGPEDYQLTSTLLGLASEITPDNTDIIRRRIEAAYGAGDANEVLRLTRDLVRLDPRDTVALLRLITSTIASTNNTAEDRVEAYDKFILQGAKTFDSSILSRLALDAAMLVRERGDEAGFIKRLTISTQLDPTHKEAAALAATVFAESRPNDVIGRLRMLENLLIADPVDPNVHYSICRELAAGRAYASARRFHDNAARIYIIDGKNTGDQFMVERNALLWNTDGPAAVVAKLNRELAEAQADAQKRIERARAAKGPEEKLPKAEDVQLNLNAQNCYVLALSIADPEAAFKAIDQLAATMSGTLAELKKAQEDGKVSLEEAQRSAASLFFRLQAMRLLTGIQVDQARTDLEKGKVLVEDPAYVQQATLIRGLLAIRSGKAPEGISELGSLSETDPTALLGVAIGQEALGRTAEAQQAYNKVIALYPMDIMGAWARSKLLATGFKEDTRLARALELTVADIPRWVDQMADQPTQFEQVSFNVDNLNVEALEKPTATLTIQNISEIPLALGPDRPISSKFLIAPKLDVASAGRINLEVPEVLDADRRLRLMPREKIQVEVWPDPAESGWLMEFFADRGVRVRWRAIQGFVPDQAGGYRPGVMGIVAETNSIVRRPLPEAVLPAESLAKKIADEPASILYRFAVITRAALMRAILTAPPEAPKTDNLPFPEQPKVEVKRAQVPEEVAAAYAARYPRLGPLDRAALVVTLPHAGLSPTMAVVDQVMRAETDALALCLVLATRVTSPADPLLVKCKESDDPRVKEVAILVADRLADQTPVYARWTPADLSRAANAPPDGGATK